MVGWWDGHTTTSHWHSPRDPVPNVHLKNWPEWPATAKKPTRMAHHGPFRTTNPLTGLPQRAGIPGATSAFPSRWAGHEPNPGRSWAGGPGVDPFQVAHVLIFLASIFLNSVGKSRADITSQIWCHGRIFAGFCTCHYISLRWLMGESTGNQRSEA